MGFDLVQRTHVLQKSSYHPIHFDLVDNASYVSIATSWFTHALSATCTLYDTDYYSCSQSV